MSRFEQWEKVNLQAGVQRFAVYGGFFMKDALGNRLGVIVTNGNAPVALTGQIKGIAKLPPHTDDDVEIFEITGAIDPNDPSRAYVDLPAECYYYSGQMTVSIRNIVGDNKTVLASFAGWVDAATDGLAGTPTPGGGGSTPTYIIDDVPTNGSQNLVKSGGVYSAIQTVSGQVSTLSTDLDTVKGRVDTVETTLATKADASELSKYVPLTRYGSSSQHGILRIGQGFLEGGGIIVIGKASSSYIKAGTNKYNPIVSYNQHESVFYGLAKAAGDTTQSASSNAVGTYTDDAKTAIKTMLGITDGQDLSHITTRLTSVENRVTTLENNQPDMSAYALTADLQAAETRITSLESANTSLGNRLTTAEGKISTLETNTAGYGTRLTTAETDISGLKTRMSGAEEDISTVSGNVSDLSSSVTTNTNNIRTANTNIASLQTRMTAAENAIDAIDTSSTSTFEARISALEAQMSDVQSFMINGFETEDITDQVTLVETSGNFTIGPYVCTRNGNAYSLYVEVTTTSTVAEGANATTFGSMTLSGPPLPSAPCSGAMFRGASAIIYNMDSNGLITMRNTAASLASGSWTYVCLTWFAPFESASASTQGVTTQHESI